MISNDFAVVFLQASGSSSYMNLVFIGLMFVVMYFFMIRPQQKKAKEQKAFRDAMAKGDFVQTLGGIHGRIASIEEDDTVWLEVDNKGTKIKIEKAGIGSLSEKKF